MPSNNRIAQKIRDLLARAKSTDSTNEAEQCLRIAAKLADEHAIDLLQLETDDPSAEWHWRELEQIETRMPTWGVPVGSVLGCLHVRVTTRSSHYTIDLDRADALFKAKDYRALEAVTRPKPIVIVSAFGREEHVAIAEYLWVYLCRCFRTAFAERINRATPAKAFYCSMAQGLMARIAQERRKEQTPETTALMINFERRLDDEMAARGVKSSGYDEPDRFSAEAYQRGQNTPLNMPLPSVPSTLCLEHQGAR